MFSLQHCLTSLAAQLLERRQRILAAWRARVEADPECEDGTRLSSAQFYDHIPLVLDVFERRLLQGELAPAQKQRADELAHQHSRHRWQQGYSMRSLLYDWSHLNTTVVAALDELELPCSDEACGAARSRAHLAWAELVGSNLSEGAITYSELLEGEAAARLSDLEDAFERAGQWERERGELLRQTSHDLRGGLSLVVNASELLHGDRISSEDRGRVTEILRGGARSLSEMLSDLLTVSRLEAGAEKRETTRFDVAEMLGELGAGTRNLAQEKELWLHCEGPSRLEIEGDATKIKRIAQNLLLNALGYTRKGGVDLSWGQTDDAHWFLEVADTGPGLSGGAASLKRSIQSATHAAREADPQTITSPETPSKTDEAGAVAANDVAANDIGADGNGDNAGDANGVGASGASGEGIGLSIVRRLCELLDARMELDSSAQGTRFRVVLPSSYGEA